MSFVSPKDLLEVGLTYVSVSCVPVKPKDAVTFFVLSRHRYPIPYVVIDTYQQFRELI